MKKAIEAVGIIVFLLISFVLLVGVTSAAPPALSSWYNNYTCDNSTIFTISHEDNRTVFFNVTANQTMEFWVWHVDGALYQNSSADNITYTWDSGGDKIVSVYGSNANGQTDTLTWDIEIEYTGYEYEKLIYKQNLLLLEENEMIAQTWLFLVLLLIAFVFMGIGYLSPNSTFKMFGVASSLLSSLLFFVLSYAIIANQFGEMLQMPWLATLLGALGLVQAIYTLLLVISLLYSIFTSRRQAGMDSIPFDPQDKNW